MGAAIGVVFGCCVGAAVGRHWRAFLKAKVVMALVCLAICTGLVIFFVWVLFGLPTDEEGWMEENWDGELAHLKLDVCRPRAPSVSCRRTSDFVLKACPTSNFCVACTATDCR
jgi:hypothetical protein